MAFDYTPQQERAIYEHNQNLLVSAAAGSGKTAVLAARCVALISSKQNPCNADDLLVVTYTNAAAAEMRERITQLLTDCAIKDGDSRLHRQVLLLAGAQIGTIHAFCATMLRRHFHELGLDPSFRLMDENESSLMRTEVASELVERKLLEPDSASFGRLVEHYAGGSPTRITEVILRLYLQQSSLLDPAGWLAERRGRVVAAIEKPLRESAIGRELFQILSQRAETLTDSATRLEAALRRENGLAKYADHVAALASAMADWKAAIDTRPFDQASDIIRNTQFNRLPALKPVPPDKEAWQERINAVAGGIKKLAQDGILRFTEDTLRQNLHLTLWASDALAGLVAQFRADFDKAKHEAGLLDFNDLERYALRLLRREDGGPSAVALSYRRQFRHVLVDEYQDVNELQDTLVGLLADESAKNLFTVGDVKQSIYRFRQADPQRFIDRYKRYKQPNGNAGEVIDLQKNFRSRGPLLETLNAVFERLMTRESAEVAYTQSQRLVPGAPYPHGSGLFTGSPIELHIIEKEKAVSQRDYEADEREAVLVALRIRQLLGFDGSAPAQVADRDGATRAALPGDVAILLRAMRIKAERFATILRNAGIPVQADSTTGFFAATEVQDVLAALRAIDNQRSDYDIAGYLRSPLCGLERPEDALAEIRLKYPDAAFHLAVQRYVAEQADPLAVEVGWCLARLDRWAAAAQQSSVAEVIQLLLEETSYSVFVAGLSGGPQRSANLAELLERARSFERYRRPTLSRFLRYIATLEDQGDLGMPAADGQARNAVRVMSIHKSKGLEFPIVVLPDLGKDHNLRDSGGLILVDESVGLALKVVDAEREANYPSLASTIAAVHIRRRALAEELRVLYVAMTRAREHLILVGTEAPAALEEWDSEWRGHVGPLPPGTVLAGRSMLDWIGPAAALTEAASPGSFQRQSHTVDDVEALAKTMLGAAQPEGAAGPLHRLQPIVAAVPPTPSLQHALDRLTYVYPHSFAAGAPATVSVTDLVKTGQSAPGGESASREGVVEFERVLRPPRFLTLDEPLTAADAGAVTHTVLQRLDFARPCDAVDLKAQILQLIDRRFIRAGDADRIDLDAILWFLSTDLGQQFRATPQKLLRELEIVYGLQSPHTTAPADRIMVRGRLDVVLAEDDGLTLVDYKTDRVIAATVAARSAFYQPQIDAYRTQLELLTSMKIKRAFLVFLTARALQPA